jgi:hypothetical protein
MEGGELVRTVVSQPVSKVDAGNHQLVELLATGHTGHEKLKEGVFNVAMAPCWS